MAVRCLLSAYRHVTLCLHDGRLHDGGGVSAAAAATQPQQQVIAGDDENVNYNSSAASATRRFFSQVDRLFEGPADDRERALELLRAKEQQVNTVD